MKQSIARPVPRPVPLSPPASSSSTPSLSVFPALIQQAEHAMLVELRGEIDRRLAALAAELSRGHVSSPHSSPHSSPLVSPLVSMTLQGDGGIAASRSLSSAPPPSAPSSSPAKSKPAPRAMSVQARRRISAAQLRRWALHRAAQAKAQVKANALPNAKAQSKPQSKPKTTAPVRPSLPKPAVSKTVAAKSASAAKPVVAAVKQAAAPPPAVPPAPPAVSSVVNANAPEIALPASASLPGSE